MEPLVSIIINCYNQGRYLERSVTSVLSQTFANIECLIVDDGSTDNTSQVAEHLMNIDSRVKYYHKENGGLPSARNFGFQKAQGEWIQYLDADDWIHEDKIRFQLSHLQAGDEKDIVFYTDYERVFFDKDENVVDRQKNVVGALTKDELIQRLLTPDFLAGTSHPALQQAMLLKKSVLSHTKFPESLKALGDRYFAVDILMKDAHFIYTPMIGAYYTKHQSNRTNNWNYMIKYYISFYEMVLLNYPQLNSNCQVGLNFLVDEAIREKEKDNFDRLIKIAYIPVKLMNEKLKFYNKLSLQLFYLLRLITPNFVLYEKYRGPRLKKLLSIFSN